MREPRDEILDTKFYPCIAPFVKMRLEQTSVKTQH
jgi:hypothetical protein